MNFNYFEYIENENLTFGAKEKEWITFLGDKNKHILDNILFKNANEYITINFGKITNKSKDKLRKLVGFSSFDMLDVFLAETVKDELAYGLESLATKKEEMSFRIDEIGAEFRLTSLMDQSGKSLSTSAKVKLSIARSLITKPKILVLDNILSSLDEKDYKLVTKNLIEYVNNGGIILNFTTEIEETLLGSKVIITNNEKILLSGYTLSVLNEEKLMKRLGFNLPFIILLNKYLKDYELINYYVFTYERLVDEIWK